METSEDDFGGMDVAFVQEHLDDFNCSLATDALDDTLNKLNAISTMFAVSNVNLIDGLIAFMKNSRRTELSMNVLGEYEQILLKAGKIADTKASINIQSEREVLKELKFGTDLTDHIVVDEETEELGASVSDFEAFDNDKNYASYKSRQNIQRNSGSNNLERLVKSRYTGPSFVPDEQIGTGAPMVGQQLPALTIISDCQQSSYQYGHSNISFDICELFSSDSNEENGGNPDDGDYQELPTLLTGSIFPSEGIQLNLDNAMLLTNSYSFPLDFEQIDGISIYPGMRITVNCVHEQGVCRIQRVVDPPALEMDKLDSHITQLPRLKVLIASGPFLNNELNFDQIVQLFDSAHLAHVNALILTGPFVPENIELSSHSPQAISTKFLDIIKEQLKTRQMRIFLLPNAQSDLNSMPFFPTPPLLAPSKLLSSVDNCISFLPDPAVFELEGIRFAVSSSEILMHLCRREVYKSANMENEDRMQRLISHLFRSRSLYPLYPSDPNLPFSLPNSREKLQLHKKPHVLVLPSILQPITKVVEDCLVINPGRFFRGKGAGTFALLDVDLNSALASSSESADGHRSLSQFCEVSLCSQKTNN